MEFVTGEGSVKIPANNSTINTACENKQILKVECATHDIEVMHKIIFAWRQIFTWDLITIFIVTSIITIASCWILPNMKLLVPAYSKETRLFQPLSSLVINAN